jgi:cysteine synthase B
LAFFVFINFQMSIHIGQSSKNPGAKVPFGDILTIVEKNSIAHAIGKTPLLSLSRIAKDYGVGKNVHLFGKAEFMNPGGSVKDRPALSMVLDGIMRGLLTPEKTLIDATSGNTGIAYAMICASLGYKCRLAIPSNASPERLRTLRALGAELLLTDPLEGTDGAQRLVRSILESDPDHYYYPDQYNNEQNWRAHYRTTAPEIWEQTSGSITHFVAGLGTTGTFTGVARKLKELKQGIQTIAVQPDSPYHGLEGLKHIETAIRPGIFDELLVDEYSEIGTEEAYEVSRKLATREGIFVGISSGAAVAAALRLGKTLKDAVIVTILCDGGSRYLSDNFWEE